MLTKKVNRMSMHEFLTQLLPSADSEVEVSFEVDNHRGHSRQRVSACDPSDRRQSREIARWLPEAKKEPNTLPPSPPRRRRSFQGDECSRWSEKTPQNDTEDRGACPFPSLPPAAPKRQNNDCGLYCDDISLPELLFLAPESA